MIHDPNGETLTLEAKMQPLLLDSMTKSKDGFLGVRQHPEINIFKQVIIAVSRTLCVIVFSQAPVGHRNILVDYNEPLHSCTFA